MGQKLTKLISIMLAAIILSANSWAVVSYAADTYKTIAELENQGTSTNNENVEVDVYYAGGEHTKTIDVTETEAKLYMRVAVKNAGYLENAKIDLSDCNFEIADDEANSGKIQSIDTNSKTVILNKIVAGNEVEIVLNIMLSKIDRVSPDIFNKDNTIFMSGTYINEKTKEISIQKEIVIHTSWHGEAKAKISQEVIKYVPFNVNEKSGVLLQTEVITEVENSMLPIKQSKIEVDIPSIMNTKPEKVLVYAKTTEDTNGEKTAINFINSNYSYDENTGKLTITVKNNANTDGKISWVKGAQDKYEIVMIYPEETITNVTNSTPIVESSATVNNTYYNDIESSDYAVATSKTSLTKVGDIADFEVGIIEDTMAKGYMYNGVETTYTEKYTISISYAELTDEIIVSQNVDNFVNESGVESSGVNSIYNKKVKVSKIELQKILGETGKIEIISNSKIIATIDSSLEANSEGIIEVDISEANVNCIEIRTSKPQTEGILSVEIEKAISAEVGYSLSDMKTFTNIKTSAVCEAIEKEETIVIANIEDTVKLKEPTEKATISINKEYLSTVVANNVEITALLETDSADDLLYTNPKITINLPSEVTNVNLKSIQVLHVDEMNIGEYRVIDNGINKAIEITLNGTQTKYNDDVTKGINVLIYADLELSKITPSKEAIISMNVGSVTRETIIQFVAPTGIVTTNTISGYALSGENITVVDNEIATAKLDIYSETRTAKINAHIINNNNNSVSGISVLGRIPCQESVKFDSTDKQGNNIDTTLVGKITVYNLEAGAYKIYYSTNSAANKDLTDANNNWSEQVEDYSLIKSYLIVLNNDMEKASQVSFEYSLNIPANLPYNKTINSSYKVYYTNNLTTGSNIETKESPIIEITTGVGPEIEGTISAVNIEDGNSIAKGSLLTYNTKITNTGTVDVQNVKLSIHVPEGMECATSTESIKYNSETRKVETTLNTVQVGQEQNIECSFIPTTAGEKNIVATITADEFTNEISTNTYTVNVEDEDLVLRNSNASGVSIVQGVEASYILDIQNYTDSEIKNIKIEYKLPEGIKYKKYTALKDLEEEAKYDEITNMVTINIPSLSAKETITIFIYGDVEKVTNNMQSVATATVNGKKYTSNVVTINAEKTEYSITGTNPGEKYVKEGQELVSEFTVKNIGENTIYTAILEYNVPEETTFVSGSLETSSGTKELYINSEGKIKDAISVLEAGESANIVITLKANKLSSKDDKEISSYLTVSGASIDTMESNKIDYVIEYDKDQHENNTVGNNEISNPGDIDEEKNEYKITGKAWLDKNQNGKYDSEEELISGITVLLINKETGKIVKGEDNKNKMTTTDNNGKYSITDLENGDYLVAFLYDNEIYSITEYQKEGVEKSLNSDAISTEIQYEGVTRKAGITDTLTIEDKNIRDVDIGLYEASKFDLSLDKYVSNVTVNNSQGVSTYNYTGKEKTLAKIDIPAKQMSTSTVIIEYTIVVKNEGTVPGYAKKIVDYLPEDLKFSSELNPAAYLGKDGNIYSEELAQTIINPGESKEIKLILTKKMTSNNTGTVVNTAEIAESYNKLGLQDTNSSAGNKDEKENDLGVANVIITVKTGQVVIYTALIVAIIAILAGGIFGIKKYVIKTKEN